MRIQPIAGLLLALLPWSDARAQVNETKPARPNIVIIMPDDVGYGDFSFTGNPVVKTPHIDALAKQSVRLRNFHVSPTCSPTRCSLMSGRHEFKSGVTHTMLERERMSLKVYTLAQMLKSTGYATGIFGKWHLGDEDAYQPDKRGFDEVFIHGAGGIGQGYVGSCGDAPGNMYQDPAILHNGRFEKTKGYCTDLFFGQASTWINTLRNREAPFFAYITPNAAHTPLQCPEEYAKRHRAEVCDDVAKFYGMIENIDDNVGRFLAQLKAWNLDANTIVIFLTDNGGTLGVKVYNAGMRAQKGTPYEGGTRVPLLWRWPGGSPADVDVDALTAHIDIYPTLVALTGAQLPATARSQIEGRNLLPLLKGTTTEWPNRYLVTHVGRWDRGDAASAKFVNCSIRDERYALVNNKELFDLKADPGQKQNIISQNPDIVARLRREYDTWWADVLPRLENEEVPLPKMNPFKERYWKQFGGGPDEKWKAIMDPASPMNRRYLLPRDRK